VNDRSFSSNGRVTPKAVPDPDEPLPSLRRRSPLVYWTAVLVVVAMAASALGTIASILF